jgi:hypothetical protein
MVFSLLNSIMKNLNYKFSSKEHDWDKIYEDNRQEGHSLLELEKTELHRTL